MTCEAVHRSLIRTQLIFAWKKPKCTNFIMNDDHGCVCVADPLQIVWERPTRKPCCIRHVHFPDYVSFIKPARVFKGLGVLHLFHLMPVPTLCVVCVCPCCACLHCVYAKGAAEVGRNVGHRHRSDFTFFSFRFVKTTQKILLFDFVTKTLLQFYRVSV